MRPIEACQGVAVRVEHFYANQSGLLRVAYLWAPDGYDCASL